MSSHDTLRQTLARLRSPVNDQDVLLQLLSTSLKILGIFPDSAASSAEPLSHKSLLRFIPEYQTTLLEQVVPHWLERVQESENTNLLTDYFIPPRGRESGLSNETPRMESILSAYSVLTGHAISQFSVDTLARLSTEVTPLDVLQYLSEKTGRSYLVEASQRWSDYMKEMFSVPGKTSNAIESSKVVVPSELAAGPFLAKACQSWTSLISHHSYKHDDVTRREAGSLFLGRLVALGCFPAQPPLHPSSPSFWNTILPNMRRDIVQSTNSSSEEREDSLRTNTGFGIKFSSVMALLPISPQLSIVMSLLSHLDLMIGIGSTPSIVSLEAGDEARGIVKRESLILRETLGDIMGGTHEVGSTSGHKQEPPGGQASIWPLISSGLGRRFSEGIARVIVCWAAQSKQPETALELLLNRTLELWADEEHIRHSTLRRHCAVTCLLLTTIRQLGPVIQVKELNLAPDAHIKRLATKSIFIRAVGVYIEHSEPSVRLCGMLTAETVAKMVGSKLQFPGWEDDGDGQDWARQTRSLFQGRDIDVAMIRHPASPMINDEKSDDAVHPDVRPHPEATEAPIRPPPSRITIREDDTDSDDSLEGYVSESPSSRASSPQPPPNIGIQSAISAKPSLDFRPTIEEINADPTLLNPLQKKIQKPVYLLDLGRLLKVGNEGNEQCESIQVALNTATSLVRKKAGWGLELDENAVDLTHSLIGLQNNYMLEEFDHRVLEALTALVVCAPRKAALCIIEHFFTPSYSTSQRFTMLNALALGARELAGLPTPQISLPKLSFPSRLLPASAHRKYYTIDDESDAGAQIRGLVDSISTRAIEKGREGAEERVPEIVRERQLTVRLNQGGKAGGIVELQSSKPTHIQSTPNVKVANSFNQIASEYFILPFVSKFWEYLQDTLAREERSMRSSRKGEEGFRAAGTAMILSPLVLSHFINTMSIMVHASRHSPAFLAVIAPAVLELAVTLGTRKMNSESQLNSSAAASVSSEDSKRSASVLSASLELAIVILDASIDLDSGKTLALEHGGLVSGIMLWAQKAFSVLESGLQLEGVGGQEEGRLRKASAGLILKLDEITRKWSQAMLMPF